MSTYGECLQDYRAWREKHGTSNCDRVIRIEGRRRVNPDREDRVQLSKAEKQKRFDRQKGICSCGCGERLLIPAWKNDVDHIDVNRIPYNHPQNLALCLPGHNRSKSAKSIQQLSKEQGRSFSDIIEPGIVSAGSQRPIEWKKNKRSSVPSARRSRKRKSSNTAAILSPATCIRVCSATIQSWKASGSNRNDKGINPHRTMGNAMRVV